MTDRTPSDDLRSIRILGIPTELHVYPGECHGFEMIVPDAAVSKACQRDMTEALRRALRPELFAASTS